MAWHPPWSYCRYDEFQAWHERSGPLALESWNKGKFKLTLQNDEEKVLQDAPIKVLLDLLPAPQ